MTLPTASSDAGREFGNDEGVAGAAGGEGFAEAEAFAVGAGKSVVDVHPGGSTPRVVRASRWAVRSCPEVEQRV